MKKIFSFLTLLIIISTTIFSEEKWNDRSFEIEINAPVNLSNNLITLNDVFTDVMLIDFTEIADNMPSSGFSTIMSVNPSIGINLDLKPGLILGFKTGMELYSNFNISKSLFDFLGYGNEINQDIDIGVEGFLDTFAYFQTDIGINTKHFKIKLSPSLYTAVFHLSTSGSEFKISNSEKGEFSYLLNGNLSLYSLFGLEDSVVQDIKDKDYTSLVKNSLDIVLNSFDDVISSFGLDLKTQIEYDYSNILTFVSKVNIPLIPAALNYVTPFTVQSEFSTSVNDLVAGNFNAPTFTKELGTQKEDKIIINRPLKISLGANIHAWNNVMEYYTSFGLGFDHPFSSLQEGVSYYFDYSLGMRVGFLNVINLYLSTERLDRIFIHKMMLALNFKFAEIDIGLASESSSLVKSFNGAGLGVFANVKLGL